MTNLVRIFVLALLVCSACAGPVKKAESGALVGGDPMDTKSEQLIGDAPSDKEQDEAEPMKMDEPKSDALMSSEKDAKEKERQRRMDGTDMKAEAEKSDEKSESKSEKLESSMDKSDEKAEAEKSEESSMDKSDAEAVKADEKSEEKRERRESDESKKSEAAELKANMEQSPEMMMPEHLIGNEPMAPMPEALIGGPAGPGVPPTPSPCDVPEFKYYQPHPTDVHKYYQCDPWGTFVEKVCDGGRIWDRWTLRCQAEDKIVNFTSVLPENFKNVSTFNCTVRGQQCLHGICVEELTGVYTCSCQANYTGEFCEIHSEDLFAEIMGGNFSVEDYVRRVSWHNVSLDITYYEQFKSILEPAVYEKLISYLSHYKGGEIRYDTLINRLVKDILGDIYPDVEFLKHFNISQRSVISSIRLVPNLLSYARYSSDRYPEVLVQYEHILDQLWNYLNSTMPTLRQEAIQYTHLAQFFLNGTISPDNWKVLNSTVARRFGGRNFLNDTVYTSDVELKDTIHRNFVTIVEKVNKLYELIHTYERAVVAQWKKDPETIFRTVVDLELPGSLEFVNLFDEIRKVNCEIWQSLVSYGFWYITNIFNTQPIH